MDIGLQQEWNVSAWQAVTLVFLKLFKEKLMLATNGTECLHVQPPKELTTEALSMIVVVAIFFCFAVLGSLSTGFAFLYEENTERKKLSKNTDNKNFINNLSRKDWISNSRSFLHCFCFVKNGKMLFQTDPDKKQFECFHGIRVISNLSIICYHIGFFDIYTRGAELKPFLQSPISKLLFNTYFGADAFFVLSGFLNAYSFSKVYDKKNGKICWWHFYLKRFLRLTPAYMIMLGFYTTLLCYTGSGPIWPEYATNPVCKENLWRYLLYINNFELTIKSVTLCFGWLAAGILIWISFFALLGREESVLETALHNSVKHLFFSVGLSWIIFVCLTEQGRFINAFLSWKLFLPFSKLSYCSYLIHGLIITRDYQATQGLEGFCLLSLVFYVFRVYFWTFIFSIPGSLLFEMPMINLFDLYMKKEEIEKREERKEKIKKK